MKKALLVGINQYGGGNQLNGCVNDIMLVNDLIKEYKADMEIKILTDHNATTENIMNGLNWLVENAQAGDILLFDYSGHGAQMTDSSGSHLDAVICPVDFDWKNNVVRDEDFKKIFANVPTGVNLTVISDSCHSEGLIKEMVNPYSLNKIKTMPIPIGRAHV